MPRLEQIFLQKRHSRAPLSRTSMMALATSQHFLLTQNLAVAIMMALNLLPTLEMLLTPTLPVDNKSDPLKAHVTPG
jgi:hypothetical protein